MASFAKGNSDYDINSAEQCKNEGFSITECELPAYPETPCTYNRNYFAECVDNKPRACIDSGYPYLSCPSGQVTDTVCPYDNNIRSANAILAQAMTTPMPKLQHKGM